MDDPRSRWAETNHALAALTSVRFSIVSGGLACIAGVGVLALALPAFHRYEASATQAAEP